MNGHLSATHEATCKQGLQVRPLIRVRLDMELFHTGKLWADVAEKLALERYEAFDTARREAERLAADHEDVAALEQVEHKLESKGRGKKK